jgi:hypothetical protein
VRGRFNVPVERTVLLQRALRRVSRRFQLSEQRAALQKRHLQPLRRVSAVAGDATYALARASCRPFALYVCSSNPRIAIRR